VNNPTASFCLLANPSADGVGHHEKKNKLPKQMRITDMENSVDHFTVFPNSPDREFGTVGDKINQILCNYLYNYSSCAL